MATYVIGADWLAMTDAERRAAFVAALPPVDPDRWWKVQGEYLAQAIALEFLEDAIARLTDPELGPSAAAAAPPATRGPTVFCQSQSDLDE